MALSLPVNYCPRCGTALEPRERFGGLRPCCPACGYVHFYDPKVAAAVFIQQAGQVLLIQRAVEPERGKWALPAGYVDAREDPRATAVREVREETGLDVRLTGLVDVLHSTLQPGASIIIVYAGEITGGRLQPLDDATDVAWFGPEDLPEIAFESTRLMIARWLVAPHSM
jgi:8-oxo-dGTP diphosphatase